MADNFSVRFHHLIAPVQRGEGITPSNTDAVKGISGGLIAGLATAREDPRATRSPDSVRIGDPAETGGAPSREAADYLVDRVIEEMNVVRDIFMAAGLK